MVLWRERRQKFTSTACSWVAAKISFSLKQGSTALLNAGKSKNRWSCHWKVYLVYIPTFYYSRYDFSLAVCTNQNSTTVRQDALSESRFVPSGWTLAGKEQLKDTHTELCRLNGKETANNGFITSRWRFATVHPFLVPLSRPNRKIYNRVTYIFRKSLNSSNFHS